MSSVAEIFRKHNFLILDKILNNGDYTIEAKGFIDPNAEIFNKPYNKEENGSNTQSTVVQKGHSFISQGSCKYQQS